MSSADDKPVQRPSPEEKATVEALVADCIQAMELGESDPATRLCAERPELLTHVQRRLSQLAARGLIAPTDSVPAAIGPYRIVRELGSGGMGAVYLAEQSEPVRRQVALKVVKLGMDTREVLARFHAERQALALMNHPHVAQVFDAGMTAEGRPFFAMEYVQGESLTAFCDERRLGPEPRIRLLATVCRAVQHAHDRGFIHRDLKPSNILVVEHEGQFVPKVIDFGIAKATAAAAAMEGLHTRQDQVLGTPEYMSPEQALTGGLDVDTRTDVYSLGVVLYELLCGELPFDSMRLRRSSRREMERILLDELPTTPSQRLSAAGERVLTARGGERTTVRRRVAGELDWITLKALGKQREHRYPSALAFAEDLERWLKHEPVLAAPPGRTYRLRKFVRRHRVPVAAAVVVFVSLVAGLFVSLRATSRAEAAQRQEAAALADMRAFYGLARDAVGSLVDTADERLVDVPQAEPVRRQMLADAIRFYEALRALQPTDPSLRFDLVAANERIGVLQGRLGQAMDAMATLRRCSTDVAALRAEQPRDRRVLQLSISTATHLARTLTASGRGEESRAALQHALAELEQGRALLGSSTADAVEADLLGNLAIESDDDTAAAVSLFGRALAAHARAAAARPDDLARQRAWARCQALLAEALTRQNRLDEALAELTAAAGRLQALPAEATAALRETEAAVQDQFAEVLRRLGRRPEAAKAQQRAVDLFLQLASEHPDVPAHADRAAGGWHTLAQIAQEDAQLGTAIELARKAATLREQIAQRHPQDHRLQMRFVRSLMAQAEFELERWQHHGGAVADAQATLARAVAATQTMRDRHTDDVEVVVTFAAVHQAVAALREAQSQPREALEEHLAVRTVLQEQLARTPNNPVVHYHLATVHNNLVYAHYRTRAWAEAIAAGEAGMKHVQQGLALDARHRGLLDVVPQLIGRIAAAQFAAGDFDAGIATIGRLCEMPDLDANARETGAILLAQYSAKAEDHPRRDELLARAERELRQALAARGSLQDALQRPDQKEGFSHTGSRLRDFDLRIVLADLLRERSEPAAQTTVLDEALALGKTLPNLPGDRVRNLYAQAAELALQRRDAGAAEQYVDELMARVGDDGGANYMAAVLLSHSSGLADAPADKDRIGGKATARLRLALENDEVKRDAAAHPNFAPLRGRADYEALLEK